MTNAEIAGIANTCIADDTVITPKYLYYRNFDLAAFAAAIEARTREDVAKYIMNLGYATGHGDTLKNLLDELIGQTKERTKEECAKVCIEEENKAWQLKGTKDWTSYIEGMSDGAGECAAVIRAMP